MSPAKHISPAVKMVMDQGLLKALAIAHECPLGMVRTAGAKRPPEGPGVRAETVCVDLILVIFTSNSNIGPYHHCIQLRLRPTSNTSLQNPSKTTNH